jgi:hypothetical protein
MKSIASHFIVFVSFLFIGSSAYTQDSIAQLISRELSSKYFDAVSEKTNDLTGKIDEKTEKYISKIKKQEEKLFRKLYKKDSIAAIKVFGNIHEKYSNLKNEALIKAKKVGAFSKVYSSRLDSLTVSLNFLDNNALLSSELQTKLKNGLENINSLSNKLNQADQIKKYLKERKQYLTEQLGSLGLIKELKQFNKKIYYYHQQIKEYTELLENPAKLESKVMELLVKVPAFRDFFNQNSQLATLFRLPGSSSNNLSNALAGLQTRATIQQDIINRLGSGADVQRMIQDNLQQVEGQVNQLKNELNQRLPQGGGSDEELPNFKPNNQKTKSFFQRLEAGTNFQTQRATNIFPTSTDFGLSLGYRLSDKNIIGIGASYRVGWGTGWNNIRITHQGIGLRTFIDLRLKGSFFISGGYERNYKSEIRNFSQLRDQSGWQQSGLIGLSKAISVKSKLLKKAKMQLLWDFLSYDQIPRATPIVFRISYSFK